MRLLVATSNSGKLIELREILDGVDLQLVSLKEAGIEPPDEPFANESGRNRTFNLWIKSPLLCQLSYAPVSVDRRRRRCVSGTRETVKLDGVADRTRTGNTWSHSPVLYH